MMIIKNALWCQGVSGRLFNGVATTGMTFLYFLWLMASPAAASEMPAPLSVPAGSVSENIKKNAPLTPVKNAEDASPVNTLSVADGAGGDKKGLIFFPMKINYSQQDDKGGVVVNVVNTAQSIYLLQGTVSAFDADTGRAVTEAGVHTTPPPFVILPPLRRLGASDRTALRVRQAGGELPRDRESAAIVSVKAIPADSRGPEAKGSAVRIALRMNMRLFWRPAGVPAPDMKKVASSLAFTRRGSELDVKNPTPWFVHFTALDAGGKKVQDTSLNAWVPPMGNQTFKFDQPVSGTLTWTLSGDENAHQTKQ